MRTTLCLLGLILSAILAVGVHHLLSERAPLQLEVRVAIDAPEHLQVFWSTTGAFDAFASRSKRLEAGSHTLAMPLPPDLRALRIDPLARAGTMRIESVRLSRFTEIEIWSAREGFDGWAANPQVESVVPVDGSLEIRATGADPQLVHDAVGGLAAPTLTLQANLAAGAVALLGLLGVSGLMLGGRRARRGQAEATSGDRRGSGLRPRVLVATAVTLMAGAGGWWALQALSGNGEESAYFDLDGAYRPAFVDRQGRRLTRANGPLALMIDPFCGYLNYPGLSTERFTIDDRGFRGGVPLGDEPRVVLLGGSTVFGHGLEGDAATVTGQLGQTRPELAWVNAGVVGYASGQELGLLVHHAADLEPAALVVVNGWNDISERLDFASGLATNRVFGGLSQALRDHAVKEVGNIADPLPVSLKPVDADGGDVGYQRILEDYVRNVVRMHAWAEGRGIPFVVILQPERTRATQKPLPEGDSRPERVTGNYRAFVDDALDRLQGLGIRCVDAVNTPEFEDARPDDFLDAVHLAPGGIARLANLVDRLVWDPRNKALRPR